MQTIAFLPDRLNAEPVVFRGFTTPEMGLAALAGIALGLAVSLPLIPLAGWVILPTGMLVEPLLLISFGGRWLAHAKRGKPENYIWLKLEEKKRRLGIGDPALIIAAQGWSLRRSRRAR
ncbi:TIGR03750 family conjugal transfer protein [Xenorhabdus griffiniae]|uniref:TIGR03750 family conjugal transfer protein n=1 Tax=Xenorhabdus griffiniae TaxID=351672 RepID=A0ABY9XF13_9GAMM|nr:TIGR03750 family conjugal transfer protein [Xenorhabdus griffiniae]MBD1228842.1 TIGR03750 family conjugal transfer protein [Xenorhabdus griffiniae]MBE8588263.1 TIGR03750 family conjugal transfer protein [Xenorhabdus griffiniae]WMV71507.1 TIGR03750 family conjugal transfer protein [Xenorhabdus griffiniae]WNH01184.1 TIGR03750 family conjugal transfer protein [Xenorhabdus griffiniae]